MHAGLSVTVNPIGGSWLIPTGMVLAVTVLTLLAYRRRLRGTSGMWRWVALSLRLLALFLCLWAALRPSVYFKEKKRQAASLVFLVDTSSSMTFGDEVGGKTRWAVANQVVEQARETAKTLGPDLDAKFLRFDTTLAEAKEEDLTSKAEPKGRATDLGTAMIKAQERQEGTTRRTARMIIISDFTSNTGINPLVAARRLKGKGVPVVTVGLGSEHAGAGSRDIALRDIVTSPTVFAKNKMEVRGSLLARGFAGQPLEVELFVEDLPNAVAQTTVKVPESGDVIPITGLNYTPQTPGEKKLTLKVAQHEGELVKTNNQISTFVTVLSGGLNVLFLQGSNFSWDYKYMMRAIATSPDIQVQGVVIKAPAQGEAGAIGDDAEFAPGRYNVYILSDLPADYLTAKQHTLLARAVMDGAGLMMLGGHSSFGAGGWADSPLAEVLPVQMHPGDGQNEPEAGLKFSPNTKGLNSFVLQVGASRAETQRIWDLMPPIQGTNRFVEKVGASILAETGGPNPEPLMLSHDVGKGRAIAYGGETWVWARATEESRLAHRKFWRQVIFWLSHKENDSDNQVKLTLSDRRLAVGEKLELTITARDAKGAPIPNVRYEAKVEREKAEPPVSVPVDQLYNQGDEAKGSVYATEAVGEPGNYTITAVATRDGQEIGRDKARFLVYQDDRELENPSADLALARQIATITDGESVSHERLTSYLKSIDRSVYTEYVSPTEYKVWDNWPFLLIFTALLTLEWWLRKRHGWV